MESLDSNHGNQPPAHNTTTTNRPTKDVQKTWASPHSHMNNPGPSGGKVRTVLALSAGASRFKSLLLLLALLGRGALFPFSLPKVSSVLPIFLLRRMSVFRILLHLRRLSRKLHAPVVVLFLLLVRSASASGGAPIIGTRIVHTRYGKLQGMVYPMDHSKHLKPVEVFLGIPYATPPVLSNRFSPTRTPSPWDGIRIADKLAPVCPQNLPDIRNESAALERMPKGRLEYLKRLLPHLKNQSEDCLYLNVYSPAQVGGSEHGKHPVLVYVHGESYEWNSGNPYEGSVLSSYADLVVVTLNYRLGILGFLNANVAPHLKARVANYGLMDQIAALHWVQQNIELFGGDSGNVTLLGHGTGAACIHFLMVSPTVMPGLFHRAILLSGSALSSWALVEDPVSVATKLAQQVNCSLPADLLREHEKIVDCLRNVPLEDLQRADVVAPTYLSAFGPSVDGVVIKTDFQKDMLTYFVPSDVPVGYSTFSGSGGGGMKKRSEASMLGIQTSGTNRYDLLFGVVTSEALFRFGAVDVSSGFEGERRDKIIRTYIRNAYTYHLSEIFYTVVNEYTDWERTVMHPINTRDAAIAALGDAQYVAPLVRTGDLLSVRGSTSSGGPGTRTWFSVFDYQTKDGDYPQRMGTAHGEELPYYFGAPLIDGFSHFPKNYTKSEVTLSEAVIIYMSNFIRTGNPNDHQRTDGSWSNRERNRFRSVVWDEYDSVHQKYLEMGMKPRMKNHFRAHQLSVWLRLIPELHRAGMEDVVARHNLFRNHNDQELYDGLVRPDPLSRTFLTQDMVYGKGVQVSAGRRHHHGGNGTDLTQPVTTPDTLLTTCVSVISSYPAATHHVGHPNSTDPLSSLEAAGYAAYSTALSVTIAIGCSLLILNVLIFAGVYYQRDKTRLEVKSLQNQAEQRTSLNYDVKPGHYHLSGGSVIVDLEQDTANMILCQNPQRDAGGLLLCQAQPRFTSGTIPRSGTVPKQMDPDVARNNPDLGSPHSRNPDIVKSNPGNSPAGILMNTKPIEMNHMPVSKHGTATLPRNMTFCNNVNKLPNINETVMCPPNGSATMHMSLPRAPPPPIRTTPESQPLLPPKQHPPGSLRVPTAAMNEMRV